MIHGLNVVILFIEEVGCLCDVLFPVDFEELKKRGLKQEHEFFEERHDQGRLDAY
jgi:hypothetical protein